MNNIWKWFLILIGGIAFFWAALSLFYGITHIGVLLPMLVGLLLLLYGIGEEKIFGEMAETVRENTQLEESSESGLVYFL